MSLGTMKKRTVKFVRRRFISHGKSTTKAGAIHSLIPVRSGAWDEASVGTVQIDTVAHCGSSLAGDFVYTVNATDVPTLWGQDEPSGTKDRRPRLRVWRKWKDMPFPVVEWHPDSGSEFINWHCKGWCEKRGQRLTRSRPNHKNDNCFVEERNGHIVRRWVGYTRFDARRNCRRFKYGVRCAYALPEPLRRFATDCGKRTDWRKVENYQRKESQDTIPKGIGTN